MILIFIISQRTLGKFSITQDLYWHQERMFSAFKLPQMRVQDIDNIDDWKIAEKLFKLKKLK